MTEQVYSQKLVIEQQRFITKVYGWMSFALLITGLTAFITASSPTMLGAIFGNKLVFYGLLIGEIVMVFALVALIGRISAAAATLMFLAYSVVNGLTISAIFIAFTQGSIATTFFVTAGTFGAMSLYGYVTKTDLTKVGNILLMALVGLIIASVVNMFFQNQTLYWVTTFAGVIIFVGLTAWDTQKIKNMASALSEGSEEEQKGAIIGALALYLDFINLFLLLLRLFGRRR
jgi:FtsH-binding integral membrane protein